MVTEMTKEEDNKLAEESGRKIARGACEFGKVEGRNDQSAWFSDLGS